MIFEKDDRFAGSDSYKNIDRCCPKVVFFRITCFVWNVDKNKKLNIWACTQISACRLVHANCLFFNCLGGFRRPQTGKTSRKLCKRKTYLNCFHWVLFYMWTCAGDDIKRIPCDIGEELFEDSFIRLYLTSFVSFLPTVALN